MKLAGSWASMSPIGKATEGGSTQTPVEPSGAVQAAPDSREVWRQRSSTMPQPPPPQWHLASAGAASSSNFQDRKEYLIANKGTETCPTFFALEKKNQPIVAGNSVGALICLPFSWSKKDTSAIKKKKTTPIPAFYTLLYSLGSKSPLN